MFIRDKSYDEWKNLKLRLKVENQLRFDSPQWINRIHEATHPIKKVRT